MKTKTLILALLAVFAFIGCKDKDDDKKPQKFVYTPIECPHDYDFLFFKHDTNVHRIMKTQAEKDAFAAVTPGWTCLQRDIDFATYQLILVIDKFRPDGAYSVKFESIKEHKDHILVVVNYISHDGVTYQMPQRPYCMAAISQSNKEIRFQEKYTHQTHESNSIRD